MIHVTGINNAMRAFAPTAEEFTERLLAITEALRPALLALSAEPWAFPVDWDHLRGRAEQFGGEWAEALKMREWPATEDPAGEAFEFAAFDDYLDGFDPEHHGIRQIVAVERFFNVTHEEGVS